MARRCFLLFVLAPLLACAQPAFEVASIKPADPNANGTYTRTNPNGVTLENFSLKDCIERAFDVKDFSLEAPGWLAEARFNIAAKAPDGASRKQFNSMLRTLLIERFKLAFHHETKVMPAYALVVDKRGLKIAPTQPGETGWGSGRGMLDGFRLPMAEFAGLLAELVDRPVKDMTGLDGVFNTKLRWNPEGAADPALPTSIFTALEEQAGLRLDARKLPVEILVVDQIQRQPAEN